MLRTFIALLVAVGPLNWAETGSFAPASAGHWGKPGPSVIERTDHSQSVVRPRQPLLARKRGAHLVLPISTQTGDGEEIHLPPTILGKWCNDHNEIWIFGAKYLTHHQSGTSHEHRVRYKWSRDRMTVYVDGYPDQFLPLTPDGTRMKLLSSGLDSTMKGWLFWRCPDLLSRNEYPI